MSVYAATQYYLVRVDEYVDSRGHAKQQMAQLDHQSAPEWFKLEGAIQNHLKTG